MRHGEQGQEGKKEEGQKAGIAGSRGRGRARVGAGGKQQGQGGRGPSIVSITKCAPGIASREFLSEYEF